MSVAENAYSYETEDGYSVVSLRPQMVDAQWNIIDDAGKELIEHIRHDRVESLLVDLTALDYMGSSLVALLVRLWKSISSTDARMAVVTANETIFQVLDLAGLTRLWTVAPSYAAALHELGFSQKAKIVKRETRLLGTTEILAIVAALIGMAGLLLPMVDQMHGIRLFATIGLAAVAVFAGIISFARTARWRRALSVVTILLGSGILFATLKQAGVIPTKNATSGAAGADTNSGETTTADDTATNQGDGK